MEGLGTVDRLDSIVVRRLLGQGRVGTIKVGTTVATLSGAGRELVILGRTGRAFVSVL